MKTFERRALALVVATGVAFSAVGARLWYLQVQRGRYYAGLQRADYQRALPVMAPRGNIVTADGVTVATSQPSWTLYYLKPSTPLPRTELAHVASALGIRPALVLQTMRSESKILQPWDPIPVWSNLTLRQLTNLKVNAGNLPNLRVVPVPERDYPYGSLMGNIIGYISQPTIDTTAGSSGLEQEYQKYLAGSSGGQRALVNSLGQLVGFSGGAAAKPGDTLHLTINWRLEKVAQRALAYNIKAMDQSKGFVGYAPQANAGGVIAMNPQNGDILALASYPSYNPQKLVPNNPAQRDRYLQQLDQNPAHPFAIRPIMGRYAPGSTFKPLMATAALASKVITPTGTIFDPGYFPPIPTFHNWYPSGFGRLNIEQAIGLSDDVFFYTLGYRMGIQVMDHWMRAFQLNRLTGIDLPGEVRSLIPTPARLMQDQHAAWTPGWNLDTVIGQGISQYTLIALARADAAVANGGTLYWPHLVSSITTPGGKVVRRYHPVVQGQIHLPHWIWSTVHKGQELSAQGADIAHTGVSGTGYPTLQGFPVSLASKTGTAQKGGRYNNAFFMTYGPMAPSHSKPTILILCYIHNGNWGANSGYVARAIYDQYFKVADPAAQAAFQRTFGPSWKWPFGYHAGA